MSLKIKALLLLILVLISFPLYKFIKERYIDNTERKIYCNWFEISMSCHSELPYTVSCMNRYDDDKSPLQLLVKITCNPLKAVSIGRDDWYNMVEFSVVIYKYLYKYDEKGNMLKLEVYSETINKKEEKKSKLNYKIIEKEDLLFGKIRPGEEKHVIIEVLEDKDDPFKPGYEYKFTAELTLENGESGKDSRSLRINTPITPYQKRDWNEMKGKIALKNKDYKLAIEHFKKALDIEGRDYEKEYSWFKLYDLYKRNKDYKNAKKYAMEILKCINKETIKVKKKFWNRYDEYVEETSNYHEKELLSFTEFSNSIFEICYLNATDLWAEKLNSLEKRQQEILKKIKELDELIEKEEKEK